jgi:spore germination protein AB
MDKGNFKKLNAYHVIFLVQNSMVGLGLLSLPHFLSPTGNGQWVMPILLGVAAQITLFPMVWLCLKYPTQGLFEMNELLLGKWIGRFVNMILITYGILMLATVSEGYIRLVQVVTLPNKTTTIPVLLLFGVIIYIVRGGIKSIARFCILAFVFTWWMIYYLQWPLQKGDLGSLLPLFNFSLSDGGKAFHQGFFTMIGYELLLFYFPYIMNQKKALKHASMGIWITIFFYTAVSVASVAYFSNWQLERLLYPSLNIFKSVELTFIERVENVYIGLWVFLILSTTTLYLWMARKGLDTIFSKKKEWHLYLCVFLALIYILGPLTQDFRNVTHRYVTVFIAYGIILWPNLLLLLHYVRKARRKRT